MKVIINADDFGLSNGVNLGILEAIKAGIVTSTSLMTNMPGFEHAVSLMSEYPELFHVGLHFVTSVCSSICSDLKTLTDENGVFYHDRDMIANADFDEVLKEYQAQYDRFIKFAEIKPTHFDFHWCNTPVQVKAAIVLSKKYDIPIRAETKEIEERCKSEGVKYVPHHIPDFYNVDADKIEVNKFIDLIQKSIDKDLEIINIAVHPAYIDLDLLQSSSYNMQRTKELYVLLNPKIKEFINNNHIVLTNFQDL